MTTTHPELAYLGRSGLEIAPPSDDLRGMVVVGPDGLRIGEVDDVVVDTRDRRARLVSVSSGGILGSAGSSVLVPVETIVAVDERVHLDRTYAEVRALRARAGAPFAFGEAYAAYGVVPFWDAASSLG